MNIDLTLLGLAAVVALLFNFAVPPAWREKFILGISLLALFWLQPPLPIQWSGFLLPFGLIILIIACWRLTLPSTAVFISHQTWTTLALVGVIVGLAAAVRFFPLGWRPTLNRPPPPEVVVPLLGAAVLGLGGTRNVVAGRWARLSMAGILIALFVVVKFPWLGTEISDLWRTAAGQDRSLATHLDLSWLGYSYIAFRLLHTLRDRANGQLPVVSLQTYLGYTLFFPALLAGPIDRLERFAAEWDDLAGVEADNWKRWQTGLGRIGMGLGKKFIVADSLALGLSLTPALAAQTDRPGWLWLLLYGYAFRLYFDFSGYTDLAIGFGILLGVRLPENFNWPYWQSSITAFWQSWHITLSNWVRFYVFSPLSRSLLRRKPRPPMQLIILASQLATMIIIGVWHGITLNFFIWGAWHGIGLFVHKIWSDHTRRWYRKLGNRPRALFAWTWTARILTFHYVVLGWVWFVVPEFLAAVELFGKLVGVTR